MMRRFNYWVDGNLSAIAYILSLTRHELSLSIAVTFNFQPRSPSDGNSRHGRHLRDRLSLVSGVFLA